MSAKEEREELLKKENAVEPIEEDIPLNNNDGSGDTAINETREEIEHEQQNEAEEEEEEEETLEDYAGMVVSVLQPVSITMLLVVWAVRTLNVSSLGGASIVMAYTEGEGDSNSEKFFWITDQCTYFLSYYYWYHCSLCDSL